MFTPGRSFSVFKFLNSFRKLSFCKPSQVIFANYCIRPVCGRFNVLTFGNGSSKFSKIAGHNSLCRSINYGSFRNSKTNNASLRGFTIYQTFKTSPKMDIHPYLWLIVIRPAMQIVAVLTGRGFRKWWRDLPPSKRKYFWEAIKRNRIRLSVITATTVCLGFVYYEVHLQETPITKRKRFIVFSEDQCKQIGDVEMKVQMDKLKKYALPKHHPSYARVIYVGQRLLDANKDIKEVFDKKWTITVFDIPEENALVLPNGSIFVFSGMLSICSNNDQLACVLAHELAHCLMGHAAENVSFQHFVNYISIAVLAAIWAILPNDLTAAFAHWLYTRFLQVLVDFPYQRKLETEADEVGITLAAKACFDIRESSAFWAKMAILSKHDETLPDIGFLSTHPSHESRSIHLDSLMNEAIELRKSCGCPSLKVRDPRLDINVLTKVAEDLRKRNFAKLASIQATATAQTGVPPR